MATRRKGKNLDPDAAGLHGWAAEVAGAGTAVRVSGLATGARGVVGAELVRAAGSRPVLFLTSTSRAADGLAADLRCALGSENERIAIFPRHDTVPYDRFSPQPFIVAQRMAVLYRWLAAGGRRADEAAPVVVAPWTAFAIPVPSRDVVRGRTVHIEVGQTVDRDALVASLVSAGYARMALVEERGELAVRGSIVDVFPPHAARPVRLDLLGDEVESIREFAPDDQRSRDRLEHIAFPSPREITLDRNRVIDAGDTIRLLGLEQEIPDASVDELVDGLLRGFLPPGGEALAPVLQPATECALDFLPDDTLIINDDPVAGHERLEEFMEETRGNLGPAREARRVVCPPEQLVFAPESLAAMVAARGPVEFERLDLRDDDSEVRHVSLKARPHDGLRRALTRSRAHERALEPLIDQLATWMGDAWRVAICCPALSGAERLRTLLEEYGVETRTANDNRPVWKWSKPGAVEVRVGSLSEGFTLEDAQFAVLTEEEVFGPRQKRRQRTHWKDGAGLEGIAQLELGDPLVHSDHGIGLYRGLQEIRVGPGSGRSSGELMAIEYAGGDRLFLPVTRLNLVQRYSGTDGVAPKLDRMGGSTWDKAKGTVRASLRNMAKQLLAVHAARELAPGYAFAPRDRYFEEFEAGFPFEETPDQAGAIEDVMNDLQRPKPMDRLVCGDVGYGKTEVAIRAAFRAVMDGKQVAVLVPTTVLCQQHEDTFRNRFEGYPITVESLSRFRSPVQSRVILEGMATGKTDVVIGTHRLLQRRVEFKDLGLLIVDEEHRFGVSHKERIKKLRKEVDVLTLTATPIPRTLQMAFTGIRDLSVINTPPADRMAVRTQACRFSESLVREAILREVQRGGQVFFVHNRVRTIGTVLEMLERTVPEIKVIVAHGQMKERDLEDRMLAFMRGDADLLLCTTIIESGIDIPRANTIIINRAHTLGLAQLYQLRGRVGRSNHRAYAYLLVPGADSLSHEAERRLEAIQDLSELGSGFRLANMDLEIRGAGDLLGSEQSGNLMAVGYETYMEMLEETIEELRGKIHEVEIDPEIRLPVVARLPEDYVPEVGQRLVLYKRLASARDDMDVDRIRDEILDRYGPIPEEGENLLGVIRVKILARRLGVVAVDVSGGELALTVADRASIDPVKLVELLSDRNASGLRVTPDHRIFAPGPGPDGSIFDAACDLLAQLGA